MREPIFEMRHVSKSYPGVQALKDINMSICAREVVGLVGENGAGKSTLTKIMVGFVQPDQGKLLLRGTPIAPRSVKEAGQYGIGMVFQEQALLNNLSVAENIYLGNEEAFLQGGFINWNKLNRAAAEQLQKVEADIRPTVLTGKLSFAERQLVELSRVMALAERSQQMPIIIFDEPTTVGSQEDIDKLFRTIARLKTFASIVFISHRLDEVLQISDYLYVLKDGACVGEMPTKGITVDDLYRLMVGHERSQEYYHESEQVQPEPEVVLSLSKGTRQGAFYDVDLELHRGEILGICGVLGSGREALCRALAGVAPLTSGTLEIEGKPATLHSPLDAKRYGIGYVPVERRKEGLIQYFAVASNITLTNPQQIIQRGILSYAKETSVAQEWIHRLGIKTPKANTLVKTLSGGNQQKVVLAKWLAANVKVLILDHPTRGIDIGAKAEVYALMRQLTKAGLSILLISETLTELIAMSNRILVMKDGHVQQSFDAFTGQKPEEVAVIKYMM